MGGLPWILGTIVAPAAGDASAFRRAANLSPLSAPSSATMAVMDAARSLAVGLDPALILLA
jgi:hypothetical protein